MIWGRGDSPNQVSRLYVLQDHPDILWCLSINSHHLVTCSEDQTLCVYPAKSLLKYAPALETRLVGHKDAVTCVSLRDHVVVSGSRDRTVRVWSLDGLLQSESCLVIELSGHIDLVHYVAMDQERIYSSDQSGQLFVWDRSKLYEGENKSLVRTINFEDRGAIDCIQVRGSQIFTSFDDCG